MNKVEEFFDQLASNWDQGETHTIEEKRTLLDFVGIEEGNKVLDVACGTGVITGLIESYSKTKVLGIDISANMIDIAKEKYKDYPNIEFLHQDFLVMDEDNKFDVIIIYNAYPHFLKPNLLANKLMAMLNDGGKFAILHSLSRAELDTHHSGKTMEVSRHLMAPEDEFIFFKKYFEPLKLEETDHSYVIVGKKK